MSSNASAARLNRVIPQFLCTDLEQSCRFYRDKLGFDILFRYEDFYAGVGRDGTSIHLKLSDEPDPAREFKRQNEHLDAYIETDNVESLYTEFEKAGVHFAKPLASTPWGTREFSLEDPGGYILYFGQRIDPSESDE